MQKTTGELIKAARKKAGLTQAELGAKLNITSAAISQFEKPSSNPTFETLEKIADALGCKISELCEHYDVVRVQPDITKILKRYNSHNNSNNITNNDFSELQNDSLSYEHSHSYASSTEELDKLQDAKQIELEKKRAKPFKLYETEGPPKPFTRPLQGRELPKQNQSKKFDFLDENYLNYIRFKMARREPLTEEEEAYRMFHLSKIFRIDVFAIYYFLLNKEGKSKADEIIDRAIEQIALLTKIPEYQPKLPPEPPQE